MSMLVKEKGPVVVTNQASKNSPELKTQASNKKDNNTDDIPLAIEKFPAVWVLEVEEWWNERRQFVNASS